MRTCSKPRTRRIRRTPRGFCWYSVDEHCGGEERENAAGGDETQRRGYEVCGYEDCGYEDYGYEDCGYESSVASAMML